MTLLADHLNHHHIYHVGLFPEAECSSRNKPSVAHLFNLSESLHIRSRPTKSNSREVESTYKATCCLVGFNGVDDFSGETSGSIILRYCDETRTLELALGITIITDGMVLIIAPPTFKEFHMSASQEAALSGFFLLDRL